MGGHSGHTLGMHGWKRGCIWVNPLIGVMSKRSSCLAAAGITGRFECDINS